MPLELLICAAPNQRPLNSEPGTAEASARCNAFHCFVSVPKLKELVVFEVTSEVNVEKSILDPAPPNTLTAMMSKF